jgi:hypothetical protein
MATFTTAQQIFTLSMCTYHPRPGWKLKSGTSQLSSFLLLQLKRWSPRLIELLKLQSVTAGVGFHRIQDSTDLLESEVKGGKCRAASN